MRQAWWAAVLAVGALGLGASPALALSWGGSSTTGKTVFSVPSRTSTPDDWPVSVSFGLRPVWDLSGALGPSKLGGTGFEDSASGLLDADLSLGYNFTPFRLNLGPLGEVAPRITPFVGYRYFGAPTLANNLTPGLTQAATQLEQATRPEQQVAAAANAAVTAANTIGQISSAKALLGYSQFGGVHLGTRASMDLPFQIRTSALVGLTTLTSGGWDRREANALGLLGAFTGGALPGMGAVEGAQIKVGGATLPVISLSASWRPLPVFGLSLGYDLLVLPTDMRVQGPNQAALSSRRTTINNFNLGVQILNYSF